MFRTELTIAPAAGQLARTAQVLTMGSCFADSIGARLVANKVETRVNPFGTVFQPLALARLLRAAAGEDVDWQRHLVQARGRWQSYDLHGSVGADSPVELLQYIQEVVRQTGDFLRTADVVMLTLGTAWAYRLRETGELVSNCHKQPADLFVRELLTPDEIINALAETHAYLRRINPDLRFVLTVSPVRHLKDTLQLSAVSKSVLRLATHIVSDLLPGVAYFPAYELLVDDLRDYRFYASDMLHPSAVAEDYIWEKFARAYFDADFGRFRKEWAAVRQSLGHRPLHEGAPEHRQFLESTREKLEQLSLRKVDVADELRTVQTRLAALPVPRLPEPVEELEDDEERIDIGQGSAVSTVVRVNPQDSEVADAAEATLAATRGQSEDATARPPRLSPEEFRAQRAARSGRPERGRRDGRGKDQPAPVTENEEFQGAAFANELLESPVIVPVAAGEAIAAMETGLNEPLETGSEQEPTKKKKRRSRGGAKRTARKHALRLAAETGLSEDQLAASGDALEGTTGSGTEAPTTRPEGQKSSVIVKSQPVKRGGRRNEGGRVPRVALFAAPLEEQVVETQQVDAELPVPEFIAAETVITETVLPEIVSAVTPDETVTPSSRNSRNRKKKKAAKAAAAEANEGITAPTLPMAEAESSLPIANAEQLSGIDSQPEVETQRDENRREALPVAAMPIADQAATTSEPVIEKPAGGGKSARRNKSRAVSGGRAEKPAVDTPVVPVPDPTAVRTQVAAGRLMGSSASLVEPVEPIAKAASVPKATGKKASASKTPTKKAAAVEAPAPVIAAPVAPETLEVTAPAATPVKPKAKAAKATAEPQAATAPETPAASAKPAAKSATKKPAKAATKAEATPPAAEKPVTKAAAKSATAKPATKAAASKAKPTKAAAVKATPAKPKTPKKSAS
jgi:hypothetical protein